MTRKRRNVLVEKHFCICWVLRTRSKQPPIDTQDTLDIIIMKYHQQRIAAARKVCARLQLEWTDEDDALLAGRRGATNPLATTVNKNKLQTLREIFPAIERDVLEDVLTAAQYQVDVAATMLSDLVCVVEAPQPPHTEEQPPHSQTSETTTTSDDATSFDFEMTDVDDDDDWSEVTAVASPAHTPTAEAPHPWVLVHDEWEVVGMDGERVQTFAEMLRRAGANAPLLTTQLPKLIVTQTPVSRTHARSVKALRTAATDVFVDASERNVKSFGARKRRFLKTRA